MKTPMTCLAVILAAALAAPVAAQQVRKPGDYPPTADSLPQPGVAKGKLIGPLEFKSRIIEGTVRRYWIYVPVKYDAKTPPNLLVFRMASAPSTRRGRLTFRWCWIT